MTTQAQPAKASGEFSIGGKLPVTRLGYGAMQLTGSGVWGDPKDPDEALRVLRRAVELGVNFIDTADVYSEGKSEITVGQSLKNLNIARTDVVIATKVYGRTGQGRNEVGASRGHIMDAVDASLRRLARTRKRRL